jgi:hypothetical protein
VIIVLGAPKTGTYTIHRALLCAGVVSAHGRFPNHPPLAVKVWSAYIEGKHPLAYMPLTLEAMSDVHLTRKSGSLWPFWDQDILDTFTGKEIQFILNTRNPDEWLQSVTRWRDLRDRITAADLPRLGSGVGDDKSLMEWLNNYYGMVRQTLTDEKFLEFDIADPKAPDLLSDFLKIELPWWGRANANP